MSLEVYVLGKSKKKNLRKEENHYLDRINSFSKIKYKVLPDVKLKKNSNIESVKFEEAKIIKSRIQKKNNDFIILLDERGSQFTSPNFSKFLEKKLTRKNVKFVIGGVYGFHESIYDWADFKLSISKMCFTHQMIRVILFEQIYRAFTILNNKKYHY